MAIEQDIDTAERRAAHWIGWVLRVGVVVSATAIVIGLALVALGTGDATTPTTDSALGKTSVAIPVHIGDVIGNAVDGKGLAFIEIGILVLIATPTVRVAITMVLFLMERRRLLAGLAGFVLVVLVLGLIGIGLE